MASFLSQSAKAEKKFDKVSASLVSEINKWFKHSIPLINKFSAVRLLGWANERTLASIQSGQKPSDKAKFYLTFMNNFVRTNKGPNSSSMAFCPADGNILSRELDVLYNLLKKINQAGPGYNYLFKNITLQMVGKDQIAEKAQQLEKDLFYFDVLIKDTLKVDVEELVGAFKKITIATYYNELKSIDCYRVFNLTGLPEKTCSFFANKHKTIFDNSDLKFFEENQCYVENPFICIKKEYYCFTPYYLLNNGFDLIKKAIISCGEEQEKKFLYLEKWMNGSQEITPEENDNPDGIGEFIGDIDNVPEENEPFPYEEDQESKQNANFYDELFEDYDAETEKDIPEEDEGTLSNSSIFEDADFEYTRASLESESKQRLANLEHSEKSEPEPPKEKLRHEERIAPEKLKTPSEEETHNAVNAAIDNFEEEAEVNKINHIKEYYLEAEADEEDEEEEEEVNEFYKNLFENSDKTDSDYKELYDTYNSNSAEEDFDDSEGKSVYEELDSSIQPDLFPGGEKVSLAESKPELEPNFEPDDSDLDEPENEPEIEVEKEFEIEPELGVKDLEEEPVVDKTLMLRDMVNIINFMPIKEGKVFDYLTTMSKDDQKQLLQIIEQARVRWLQDKNDKVFYDKDAMISFTICTAKEDEMFQDERVNNIAAQMIISGKDTWDLIELRYSDKGQFLKSNFDHINIKGFSERRLKAIDLLVSKKKGLL